MGEKREGEKRKMTGGKTDCTDVGLRETGT
jgi:hypothetical protein